MKVNKQNKKLNSVIETQNQVFIQFYNVKGEKVASELTINVDSSIETLQKILQKLRAESQVENFSFFYENYQIQKNFKELLIEFSAKEIYSEKTLKITFFEDDLIDVKPITRISTSLEGHTEAVLQVQFSPCGQYAGSVSGDKTIRLWDAITETPYCCLEGHKSWSMIIQWSPDSKKFATGDLDGNILYWNLENIKKKKKEIDKLRREKSKKKLLVYTHQLTGHKKFITNISWRPFHLEEDSSKFVSSSKDGTLRFWDSKYGKCYNVGARHLQSVTSLVWSGQDYIYSGSQDKMIIIWNSEGKFINSLQGHSHWINCMSLNTHYSLRASHFFSFTTLKNEKIPQNLQQKAKLYYDKIYKILNKEYLITGSDDKTLILWTPLEKDKQIRRYTGHSGPINHVMFAPNSIIFVSASFDKTLRIWSVHENKCLAVLKAHVNEVYMLSFSNDSKWVVSASKDSTLQVWSMKEKKRAFQLPGHADEIYGVDWSIDGMRMVSCGKDKMVRIWKNQLNYFLFFFNFQL